MTPLKGVRFSTAAAAAVAENQWAVPDFASAPPPVFSPTQVPANEQVIHSIFSSSYRHHHVVSNSDSDDAVVQENDTQYFTSEGITTPSKTRKDFDHSEISFFAQQANNISPISGVSAITETRSSPFRMQRNQNPHHVVVENPMSTSFYTLKTIDMLNFKFIEQCSTISDLEKVEVFLRGQEQKNDSPQLLRAVNARIAELCPGKSSHSQQLKKRGVPPPPPPPPPPQQLSSVHTSDSEGGDEENSAGDDYFFTSTASNNISRINTSIDSDARSRSTLNFSLSPNSELQGMALVDTPNGGTGTGFFPGNTRLKPIAEANADQSPESENVDGRRDLSREMLELSKQAIELETSGIAEQESFVRSLEDLEKAEKSAQEMIENLDSNSRSNLQQPEQQKRRPSPPNLVEEIKKIRTERDETRKSLEQERARLKLKNEQAIALEQRLMQKISEISHELKSTKEHSRLAVGAERGLRTKREQELTQQTKRAEGLNRTLQETKDNLDLLRRKHSQFRLELLRSIGGNCTEVCMNTCSFSFQPGV